MGVGNRMCFLLSVVMAGQFASRSSGPGTQGQGTIYQDFKGQPAHFNSLRGGLRTLVLRLVCRLALHPNACRNLAIPRTP